MNFDVATQFRMLLQYFSPLALPDVGIFDAQPCAAWRDVAQQKLLPPSSKLIFFQQPSTDDSLLYRAVAYFDKTNFIKAHETVTQTLENWKYKLLNKETIEIPNAGKLYQDYEGKIRFLADDKSNHALTFGLPVVHLQPLALLSKHNFQSVPVPENNPSDTEYHAVSASLLKKITMSESEITGKSEPEITENFEPQAVHAAVPPPPFEAAAAALAVRSRSSWKPMLIAISAILLLVGGAYWRVQKNNEAQRAQVAAAAAATETAVVDSSTSAASPEAPLPMKADEEGDRSRPAPKEELASAPPPPSVAAENSAPQQVVAAAAPPPAEKKSSKKPSTTSRANKIKPSATANAAESGAVTTVIIGGFRDAANARRMMSKVKAAGFKPFKDENNGIIRVGAQFKSSSEAAKTTKVRSIKQRFGRGSWVLN